jgi:hypothetical protein
MARKTVVQFVDDIDGGQADETVIFGLDGSDYEIDLSAKNATELREALAPFVGSGRRTGGRAATGRRGRGSRASRRASTDRSAEIREWARGKGFTVSDRGRISREVVEAYEKAH